MRAKDTVLVWLAAGLALAGCGSDSGSRPSATAPGVAYATADAIKAGMPRGEVARRLGKPPLTSRPTNQAPSGCFYYPMAGRPTTDVWQFCFDKHGRVNAGATLYSPSQPAPPAGASTARAVLLGRGDTICQAERAGLARPVKRLNRQLADLERTPNRVNRLQAARLIGPFNETLKKALSELSAFNPPIDRKPALSDYLGALRTQTRVMSSAQKALAASQDRRYAQLIRRFNALGNEATKGAHRYGFSACAGITFS
jgi:hypothetical protein